MIRLGVAFVLPLVFRPRVHQEYLQIAIPGFQVMKDPPLRSAIAAPDAFVPMDRFYKLCFPFWNNGVFDRDQQRSLAKVRALLTDNSGHVPVVPGAQVRSRIRKLGDKHKNSSCDCSNPGCDQSDSDARSLGDGSPGGGAQGETSLIYKDKDCQDS